jgi:S-formylglutathione hydrolase FrmB
MVVMPDGGRGFYTDAVDGYAYETAIVRDLVGIVDATFRTDARREARVVGGLSMGGYGALKFALGHPDLFCAAVSHSGALSVEGRFHARDPKWEQEAGWHSWLREMTRLFGPNPAGGPNDLRNLAQRVDRSMLPALRIDCGTDDALIDENREFHSYLDSIGIAHEYQEFPGGHTWDYWDLHVQEAMAFGARTMGLPKVV